jgi:hypothetical protein
MNGVVKWAASQRQAERALQDMRDFLAMAHQCEVTGDAEQADACGAIAANKLAAAIRIDDRAGA